MGRILGHCSQSIIGNVKTIIGASLPQGNVTEYNPSAAEELIWCVCVAHIHEG